MKTNIFLITVLLALNTSLLVASISKHHPAKAVPAKIEATINLNNLITSIPSTVEFNDGAEYKPAPELIITNLAPVTPRVAEFEEATLSTPIDIEKLSPEPPKESEFEETSIPETFAPDVLAPNTPVEADFTV